jgi:membrane protein DedA with SNARE-associated domain
MKTLSKKRIRIISFLVCLLVAALIVSFTLGREWYYDKNQSILSFALIHFSGYLFFLLMPVELAYIYYLYYFGDIELFLVAIFTAFSAQLIDYIIGYSVSTAFINNILGEKRIVKAEKYIFRYGNLTILIFNLFPLSSSVIAVAAGMIKFNVKKFMVYSATGLAIKYLFLSLLF